jgi:hypothetical protein
MIKRKLNIMSNELSTGSTSDKVLKGAATGALICSRFLGPPGIAIGAIAAGALVLLLDD